MQLSHQESSHICIKLRWALYSTRIDDDNLVFLVWSQLLQQQCCRNLQSGCKIHRVLKGNKQQSWGPSESKNLIQFNLIQVNMCFLPLAMICYLEFIAFSYHFLPRAWLTKCHHYFGPKKYRPWGIQLWLVEMQVSFGCYLTQTIFT